MRKISIFILENWDLLTTIFGGILLRFFEKNADKKRLKKRLTRKFNADLLTKNEREIVQRFIDEIERG